MGSRLPSASRGEAVPSPTSLQFFGDLNDFLPAERREKAFACPLKGTPTIKHVVEAHGVPHTEIGCILVNGSPVEAGYLVRPGDRIEVFPPRFSGDNQPGGAPSPLPGLEARFVLDNHLGRLATYLRMLGFDVLYRNDFQDEDLVRIASQERRILLSRDRRLLMRKAVLYGCCLRSLEPEAQVVEVLRRFALFEKIAPFRRCLRCNHPLQPVTKQAVLSRLEPLTRLYYDEFHLCPACDRIYWKGSHYERMLRLIERIARNR